MHEPSERRVQFPRPIVDQANLLIMQQSLVPELADAVALRRAAIVHPPAHVGRGVAVGVVAAGAEEDRALAVGDAVVGAVQSKKMPLNTAFGPAVRVMRTCTWPRRSQVT